MVPGEGWLNLNGGGRFTIFPTPLLFYRGNWVALFLSEKLQNVMAVTGASN
jgi:hypothetical protein